ncbi:MAG: SAM-dependent chlorinase/fluorinase [Gammaproteobacteria bacterium]|nr:SAM-dependent chlorinase/fluorinase [Gammaproteobacteria bacterium]
MTRQALPRVITITTDFGHKGPFAAVMKGVILSRLPGADVVDLVHNIPPHWPPEAGFWIVHAYRYFPAGTVHIAIVDPAPGNETQIIIAEKNEHIFLAPDNGLLAALFDQPGSNAIYRLEPDKLAQFGIHDPSPTFHGRDIYAPLAAEIAAGNCRPAQLGDATGEWTPAWVDKPTRNVDRVDGIVITVDPFGNLITNIEQQLIEGFAEPIVHIGGHALGIETTYATSNPGDYLALINSFGVVEIARAEGSAAAGLGSQRGAPVSVSDGLVA